MAKFNIYVSGNRLVSNSGPALMLYRQGRIGELVEGKVHYSACEALYLLNRGKAKIIKYEKEISAEDFLKIAERKDRNFFTKYRVYSELRDRGYAVKTALKYGADFRVYEKGKTLTDEHSKWIVFPVSESDKMTWQDFAAKNRVAHSTKKNLLIAVVDDEEDITYYEVSWLKP